MNNAIKPPKNAKVRHYHIAAMKTKILYNKYGDLRNHRHHGLFGAIIIEPAGATWKSATDDCCGDYAEQAIVYAPKQEPFNENVVFIQNGIRLLDAKGNLIMTGLVPGEEVDPEDTGEKGYNYRSERFYTGCKSITTLTLFLAVWYTEIHLHQYSMLVLAKK